MEAATTQEALSAARRWLKPAIYVLLSCGVPWKEFSELAKSVYVEVATERFGKRGRPTNVSRTAVLTGLPRRDVRKQRTKLAAAEPAPAGYVSKASLILSAWHLEPEFKDKQGCPKVLPLEGDEASFTALLKRCGGADVQPSTLLKELIRAGSVRQRADGQVQVLKRDYIPQTADAQLVKLWGARLADLAGTYAHNMIRPEREAPRFERAALNDRVPGNLVQEFRNVLELEGQAFLERMDAWLMERQRALSAEQAEADVIRLGVGLYHIQD